MITVISGTNRPGSSTLKIATTVATELTALECESTLLDLAQLPPALFNPESYAQKPPEFERFQQAILDAHGIITVIPEYNGSFPGVMKYFIDMLRFPDCLVDQPVAFVGLSAGRWGALRAVEQLEMVYQYRHAHIYGK
ncbi:MAG: NAD(P)H-dependent oxidoreductase, partial [bacterium]|nr:NAD(P)H-dependent oxidoreductase [bacterium]